MVYLLLLSVVFFVVVGLNLWIQRMHDLAKLHQRTMPNRRMVAWMSEHRRFVFERRRNAQIPS